MVESLKQDTLRKQLEYYLSDKNLVRDAFFHKEISASPDGWVAVDKFQNCNKIKQLGVTNEEIIEAAKTSTVLEVDADNKSIHRKGNPPLPALKKQKTDDDVNEAVVGGDQAPAKSAEGGAIDPIILIFKLQDKEESKTNWQSIKDVFRDHYKEIPIYIRFNKKEGHVGFDKNVTSEAKIQEMIDGGVTVEEDKFKISKMEPQESEAFWKDHGMHYTSCVERRAKFVNDKEKKSRRGKKDNWIELNNKKYEDVGKIKNIVKNLLAKTPNGTLIKEPDSSMLKDILKYHEHADTKARDLKGFTVDVHPSYKNTRCFFVVRNDDTREDFSALKCIQNLEAKLKQ